MVAYDSVVFGFVTIVYLVFLLNLRLEWQRDMGQQAFILLVVYLFLETFREAIAWAVVGLLEVIVMSVEVIQNAI